MKTISRVKYARYRKMIVAFLFLFTTIMSFFIYHTISYTYKDFSFIVSEDYVDPVLLGADEPSLKPATPSRGTIYLTFDDGPDDYTATLLDVLKKYNVKATFFVTGRGDDAMIAREFSEGHAIGLHTFSHNYSYIYTSIDNFMADLYKVQERVKNITSYTSFLMRFPGGSSNTVSRRYDNGTRIMSKLVREVEKLGYSYFDWNVDSDDAGRARSADEVYSNVVNHLKDGDSIVLQHDVKSYSVDAVERIIIYALNNHYQFEKLSPTSYAAHHGTNN